MMSDLTRRRLVAAAPAAVIASLPAIAATALKSEETHPDAELLALRPQWLITRAAFGAALVALSAAEDRFHERRPDLPCFADFDGSYDDYQAEHRRVTAIRDAIEVDTGLTTARAEERRTVDADDAIVKEIGSTPARTKAGIQFKREVLADWQGCERDDLAQSIVEDLLAIAGGLDA